MFLDQGPITMSLIVIVIVLQILLFRSRWGLRTRAVGEHPKAAETVGIDVIRSATGTSLLGGLFAGLAGAYLSMEATQLVPGRDDGRPRVHRAGGDDRRPLDADRGVRRGAAVRVVAGASASRSRSRRRAASSATSWRRCRGQFFDALPYLVTIVVLAGLVGRSIPPAADGQPYEREAAT